jgi:hypothetical protein
MSASASSAVGTMSWTFGILIGGMWMGEVLLGNPGGTSVLGNLRDLHPRVYAMAPRFALGPSNIHEFARSAHRAPTEAELSNFLYWDALGGGLNHIWIGPVLGITVGGIGAIIGKLARNGQV